MTRAASAAAPARTAGSTNAPTVQAGDLDAVIEDLEREPLIAGAGDELAWFEAPGEADRLAFGQVLGGGFGLRFPDDQVDVDGLGVAVAAVAGDRGGGDGLCRCAWCAAARRG
jgi:hypothetical protein